LARCLVELGQEVHIVAPYDENTTPPAGAILHRFYLPLISYKNIIGHILIVLRGWSVIEEIQDVDLIHTPEYLSTGIFSLMPKKIPIVITVPGNIYERIKNGNPYDWFTTQVLKIGAKLTARRASYVIATSKEMFWWWEKTGTAKKRLVTIPYGIDSDKFYPIPNARKILGISKEKQILLYVGRLSPEKGLQFLFEAFKIILEKWSSAELHLIGEGHYQDYLIQSAHDSGIINQIIFHHWVDQPELSKYYSAANVTILPSLSEGLPRTMLEALACASPFLGTQITGVVDHIKQNQNGFLVPPGNTIALAAEIEKILSNPALARQAGARGREYVCQNLSWKNITQQIFNDVYSKI
jgi:glycosyltransferase involved in cell wall biosynthesis